MREVVPVKGVFNPAKHTVNTPKGMAWSHAVKARGTFLFIAGQSAHDAKGKIVGKGDYAKQTEQAFKNLKTILKQCGASMQDVVSTTWFVRSIEDFYKKRASDIRWEYFGKSPPTSTLVEIKRLAEPSMLVEVEAIAVIPDR